MLFLTRIISLKAQRCQSAGFFDVVLLVQSPENSRKSNSKRQYLCSQPFFQWKCCPPSLLQALLSVLAHSEASHCPLSKLPPSTAAQLTEFKPPQTEPSKASPAHTQPACPLHWAAQCISSSSLVTDEHKCLSEVLNFATIPTEAQWWEEDPCSLPQLLCWVALI